jgi:polysaccharide biosynthesis protein PslE
MQLKSPREKDVHVPSDISLRDLVAPLFRRKRLMWFSFPVLFAVFVLLGLLTTHRFESSMTILVNRERFDPLVTPQSTSGMILASNPVTEEEINSEVELLKSGDVLEKVVLTNGLADKHGFSLLDMLHPGEAWPDRVARAVKDLAKKLKVEPAIKTNVISVSYSSSNPKVSYGVLKTLGDLYVEKHIAVHRPPGSYDFFAQETQRYHKALQDSEARLRDFGQTQGTAAPDLVRTDLALQLTGSIGLLHSAQQAIAADEQRIRSDQGQMKVTPQRSATTQSTNAANLLLEQLQNTLLNAQTKRIQLLLKYDPTFPLVREADQEIAQTKSAIAEAEQTSYVDQTTDRDPTFEFLRADLAKTRADLAGQEATLVATRQSIRSMQAQMVDLDKKSMTQQDLLREEKANEDNYLLYLSKREQARMSDALDKTRIANVAIAIPPSLPVLPVHSVPLVIVVAFGLAGVLSILLAYTADYLDSSFQTPAQVIEILDIPIVISMPKRTA